MARHVMKLPDVGEGVVDAEVVEWKVKVGDTVTEDQHIVDVMTDKATVEMTAPVAGTVVEVNGQPGDRVAVGSPLVVIETDASVAVAAPAAEPKAGPKAEPRVEPKPKPKAPPAEKFTTPAEAKPAPAAPAALTVDTAAAVTGGRGIAAPTVRRRARESHIDLSTIAGSGRGGRITHQDLDAAIDSGNNAGKAPSRAAPAAPAVVISGDDRAEQTRLIGMRRVIAEKMAQSKRSIPHFSYVEEVDITELEKLRQHLNANRAPEQVKLTLLPFLMLATTRAIREFPQCNSRFDDEAGIVTRYGAVHCGVATQTSNGLMVPVVRHADQRDLWGCAAEMQRVARAARDGKAAREELSGSTITITSLGALGGIVSTPVINHPEVGIIGVNKAVERPMVVDGQIVVRRMMNLSTSFDHRIVDGYDAACFVQKIRAMLELPATLFV